MMTPLPVSRPVSQSSESAGRSPSAGRKPFNPAVFQVPMAWALIAANLIPLAGVYFWDWNLFSLMFLYGVESTLLWAFQTAKCFLLLGARAFYGVWWLSDRKI